MSNMSKVRRSANRMADELRLMDEFKNLPDWAGLAWILSPYYNSQAYRVFEIMPFAWLQRAKRLVAAMDIAWRGRQREVAR